MSVAEEVQAAIDRGRIADFWSDAAKAKAARPKPDPDGPLKRKVGDLQQAILARNPVDVLWRVAEIALDLAQRELAKGRAGVNDPG